MRTKRNRAKSLTGLLFCLNVVRVWVTCGHFFFLIAKTIFRIDISFCSCFNDRRASFYLTAVFPRSSRCSPRVSLAVISSSLDNSSSPSYEFSSLTDGSLLLHTIHDIHCALFESKRMILLHLKTRQWQRAVNL